ncbi:hypothetical protein, partial [Rhizobium leguminosarum]|uniref:hypothetical protein n=1 Tax=Rhizobium leguminosarum TaxID=384 RepID=UPI003F94B231
MEAASPDRLAAIDWHPVRLDEKRTGFVRRRKEGSAPTLDLAMALVDAALAVGIVEWLRRA